MKLSPFISILITTFFFISSVAHAQKPLGSGYQFKGNGKRDFECNQPVYKTTKLPSKNWKGLNAAIKAASHELKRPHKDWKNDNQTANQEQLKKTLLWLKNGANTNSSLSAIAIHGEDGCGNTHFTGYFTPTLKVKAVADSVFRFPLYRIPDKWPRGQKLTRQQIDSDNGLANMGLELAYSSSLLDNYFAHVQGSVRAHYIDTGKQTTLAYGGKNGFSYQSLGRYLVDNNHISAKEISLESIRTFFDTHPEKLELFLNINNSYTFFRPVNSRPFASSGAQVTPLATAAVSRDFIPLGSVLLAEIPQLNKQGAVYGYQFRLLVAQDTGAAINGAGHIDIYTGEGESAKKRAGALHHYGRIWWLLIRE